eukprot:g14127.t1
MDTTGSINQPNSFNMDTTEPEDPWHSPKLLAKGAVATNRRVCFPCCCGGYSKIPMTTKERLRLSAWQKWKFYGRFPWKLSLHLLLLLTTTIRLMSWNASNDEYFHATSRTFTYFFLPEDYDFPADRTYNIYTFETATRAIERVVKNYEAINSFSVDTYQHYLLSKGEKSGVAVDSILPVSLKLQSFTNFTENGLDPRRRKRNEIAKLKTTVYNISSKDLGPFDVKRHGTKSVNDAITSMYVATMTLQLKGYNIVSNYRICVHWDTTVTLDFRSRGLITMFLKVQPKDEGCKDNTKLSAFSGYSATWVDIPILLLAFAYIVLAIKKLRQQIKLFLYLKRRAFIRENRRMQGGDVVERSMRWLGRPVTWNTLKWGDKLSFFDLWFVFTIVACTCSCTTSVISLLTTDIRGGEVHRLLGSLGCSLLWVNLVRYLQYNRNYYMVILTIRYAAPRVLRFLVGVLPIMMGYAFFGMTYFGSESDRFSTFGASMVTLFAVLNGDVIRETFLNLFPVYPVISQIYLYSFICLFIYVVLNVFIAIVEEAFFMSRRSQGGDQSPSHHQEMMGGGAAHDHSVDEAQSRNRSTSSGIAIESPRKTSEKTSQKRDGVLSSSPLDEAMVASNSSWSRFQEFLHLNDLDELMSQVGIEANQDSTGRGGSPLKDPLIKNAGGQLEEKC